MSLVVIFSDMPLTRVRSPFLVPASLFHWSPPLFSHKDRNCVVCKKMDGIGGYHIKRSKLDSGKGVCFL